MRRSALMKHGQNVAVDDWSIMRSPTTNQQVTLSQMMSCQTKKQEEERTKEHPDESLSTRLGRQRLQRTRGGRLWRLACW